MGVARGSLSCSMSCLGADGSGCVWAWVLGSLGMAGIVGVMACDNDRLH